MKLFDYLRIFWQPPVEQLVMKQQRHFPRILRELQLHSRKRSHWAWYVWPTEKKGFSEPFPKTHIQSDAALLLMNQTCMDLWIEVLETINCLIEENHGQVSRVLPTRDHQRMIYSLQFWLETVPECTSQNARFYEALCVQQKYLESFISKVT